MNIFYFHQEHTEAGMLLNPVYHNMSENQLRFYENACSFAKKAVSLLSQNLLDQISMRSRDHAVTGDLAGLAYRTA